MKKRMICGLGTALVAASVTAALALPASAVTTSMSGTQSCGSGSRMGLHGQLVNGLTDIIAFYAPATNFLSSYKTTSQMWITTAVVSGGWQITGSGSGLIAGNTGSSCVPQV